MATSLGKIVVEFVGDAKGLQKTTKQVEKGLDRTARKATTAKQKTSGFGTSLMAMKGSAMAAVAGVAALTVVVGKSISAWNTQEQAIIALNTAMKNNGSFTAAASMDLQQYASSLQSTTTFGDEAVLKGMALASTFGMQGDKLKDTTRLALDFATATGRDLTMAMNLLGKASVGETAELKRYGIIIDQNIPKNEKFAAVLAQMEQRFGGSAAAARQSLGGALTALGNQFGDIMEGIGKTIAVLTGFGSGDSLTGLTILSGALNNISVFFNQTLPLSVAWFRQAFETAIAGVIEGIATFFAHMEMLPIVGEQFQGITQYLNDMSAAMVANAEQGLPMLNRPIIIQHSLFC
jgi:hypothetical protein